MWQFLQTYGIWILFIIFLVLMMRMHGMVGGCGMGMDHDREDEHSNRQGTVPLHDEHSDAERVIPLDEEYSDAQRRALVRGEYTEYQQGTPVRDIPPDEGNTATEQSSLARRRGGF